MTMVSFRMDEKDVAEIGRMARALGIDRSDLLRDAVHHHLVRLSAESDAAAWDRMPLTLDETAPAGVADWGPAEDWSDWADAPG